jgi:hypothetical protein
VQQTSSNKRPATNATFADAPLRHHACPRARNANAKIHHSGEIVPGSPPILNICAAATKMKYDVRIAKAEKSGLLSVFFKADAFLQG